MVINQGDIYWVYLDMPIGSEPGYRHQYVVIQNNLHNHSRLGSVVLCALTSNLKRAALRGNVLLAPGEGNLEKRSIVNVTQIITVDKAQLGEHIGTLSARRVEQILAGIQVVLAPKEAP